MSIQLASNLNDTPTVSYPPAPWRLQGQVYGSLFAPPVAKVTLKLAPEFELVRIAGRAVAWAGLVHYQPGSILTYHELLGGVLVRLKNSWRVGFTVSHIWVDDLSSKVGGRALWGVPKEIAEFDFDFHRLNHDFAGRALENGKLLASGNFHAIGGLPAALHLPIPFPDLQILNGSPHGFNGAFNSQLQLCQGGMSIPAESPLAALGIGGLKPVLSFAGLNFTMSLDAARPV